MSDPVVIQSSTDPGWGEAFRKSFPWILIPIPQLTLIRAQKVGDLTALRVVWLHFVVAIAEIITVLYWLDIGGGSPGWFLFLVIGDGIFLLVLIRFWIRARPLTGKDDPSSATADTVAGVYRTQFFLGTALAESIFLMGFVGVFIMDNYIPMWVSLPFALIGLWMMMPSRAELDRRQGELQSRGSTVSLINALNQNP